VSFTPDVGFDEEAPSATVSENVEAFVSQV
jgi:hypothetical protein